MLEHKVIFVRDPSTKHRCIFLRFGPPENEPLPADALLDSPTKELLADTGFGRLALGYLFCWVVGSGDYSPIYQDRSPRGSNISGDHPDIRAAFEEVHRNWPNIQSGSEIWVEHSEDAGGFIAREIVPPPEGSTHISLPSLLATLAGFQNTLKTKANLASTSRREEALMEDILGEQFAGGELAAYCDMLKLFDKMMEGFLGE